MTSTPPPAGAAWQLAQREDFRALSDLQRRFSLPPAAVAALQRQAPQCFYEKRPLLADEEHTVAEKYGVWGEKTTFGKTYDGVHRTTYIIDEKGTVFVCSAGEEFKVLATIPMGDAEGSRRIHRGKRGRRRQHHRRQRARRYHRR